MAAAAGEAVDGEHTVIGAAAATGGGGFVGKLQNVRKGQHGRLLAGVPIPGNEGCAEGTHDTGDIRADGLHPGDFLKGTEHCLVVEGTALDHNVPSQVPGVRQLDDLIQGVLDDGVGKSGGNVRNGCSLLLGLLHIGVHKHRTPGSQIHRMLPEKGLLGKGGGGVVQTGGEVLDKGAAAGGASLIQQNGVHRTVFQLDALHILTADVQNAVHLGVKEGGGGAMGDGLHLTLFQLEGGFQQAFPIARGAGPDNLRPLRKIIRQGSERLLGSLDGVTLVAVIEGKQQLSFLTDEGHFGCGGTGVNTQEALAPVGGQIPPGNHRLPVTVAEGFVSLLRIEQGLQPLDFKIHGDALCQGINQIPNGTGLGFPRLQSRAHGGKQVGIFRVHHVLGSQLQRADKGLLQLRHKVERAAQKSNTAPDRLSAGQTGDGLVHHCLQN